MDIIMFFINQIFREASLFLGIIALVGLLIQKKSFSEVLQGTFKTIIGVVILTQGVSIIVNSMLPLSGGFNQLYGIQGDAVLQPMGSEALISQFGSQIGISMLLAFLINVFVARFTRIKNVFLTGHHLFWFAFIFVAVGVENGLSGLGLVAFSTIFLAVYIIVVPALIRPYVKKVIGDDSFTLGHPTVILSLVSGWVGKVFGDTSKSTEDLKFSPKLNFLREITITSSLVMFIVYMVVGILLGDTATEVYGTDRNMFVYSSMQELHQE